MTINRVHDIRVLFEKKTQCKRLNRFAALTESVLFMNELGKIGLLDSDQGTL